MIKLLLYFIILFPVLSYAVITAEINASKTSGIAPLAIFFDASGTTSTSTNIPFHEVHYQWGFDDINAGQWQYGNINTRSKNRDFGPIVAHVFDTAGTYVVSVSTKTLNGDTDSATVTITVTDPDSFYAGVNTICYSNDVDFSGCPTAAKHTITNSFSALLTDLDSNKRMLFKAGDSFEARDRISMNVDGPSIISSFGEGVKPIIDHSDDDDEDMFSVRQNVDDWVISGLHFTNSVNTGGTPHIVDILANVKNFLFYQNQNSPVFRRAILANTALYRNLDQLLPDGLFVIDNFLSGFNAHVMFGGSKRMALIGNYFSDTRSFNGEHVLRLTHIETGVVSHNYMSKQLVNKAVMTIRNVGSNFNCNFCQNDTSMVVVSDNDVYSYADRAIDTVLRNDGLDTVHGRDFIFARNFITGELANEQQESIYIEFMDNVTIRNNITLMNDWQRYRGIHASNTTNNAYIYHNSCYTNDNNPALARCINAGDQSSNVFVSNNLIYAPNKISLSAVIAVEGPHTGTANLAAISNPYINSTIEQPEDFVLINGSEAQAVGVASPVFIDYAGHERIIGELVDVGAYKTDSNIIFSDSFE